MRGKNKTLGVVLAVAGGVALLGAVPALADNCVPGAAWTYTGTARGVPMFPFRATPRPSHSRDR